MASFSRPISGQPEARQPPAPRQSRRQSEATAGKEKQRRRGLGVAQLERIRLGSATGSSSASATPTTAPFHFSAAGASSAPFEAMKNNLSTPNVILYPYADQCSVCHQKKKAFVEQNNLGGVLNSAAMTNCGNTGSNVVRNPMSSNNVTPIYTRNYMQLQGNIQEEVGIGHKRNHDFVDYNFLGASEKCGRSRMETEAAQRTYDFVDYNFFGASEKGSRSRMVSEATQSDQLVRMSGSDHPHPSFSQAEMVGPSSGGGGASCVTTSTSTGGVGGAVDASTSVDLTLRLSI